MKNPTFLVIIPARANSQRLPGKNMRLLDGKPLIAHSIDYAKAYHFSDIVVSTNDAEIAQFAQKQQVEIVARPEALSTHTALVITALQHAIEQQQKSYDYVVLLQPTNPLRPKNLMQRALKQIKTGKYQSLMTVSPVSKKIGKLQSGTFVPFTYEMGQRSQDLEPIYAENGLLYIISTALILQNKLIGNSNHALVVEHPFGEIDIDTLEDFRKAELYQKHFKT